MQSYTCYLKTCFKHSANAESSTSSTDSLPLNEVVYVKQTLRGRNICATSELFCEEVKQRDLNIQHFWMKRK